MYKLYPLKQ